MATKTKISVRDVAIGATGLAVLLVIPKIGDVLAKGIGSIRDMIGGRK